MAAVDVRSIQPWLSVGEAVRRGRTVLEGSARLPNRADRRLEPLQLVVTAILQLAAPPVGVERRNPPLDRRDFALTSSAAMRRWIASTFPSRLNARISSSMAATLPSAASAAISRSTAATRASAPYSRISRSMRAISASCCAMRVRSGAVRLRP